MSRTANESAGKRKRSRLRKGAPWLKTMLASMYLGRQAAEKQLLQGAILSTVGQTWSAESHLRRRRLDLRTAIYHILKDGVPHQDLDIDPLRQAQARGQGQAARRSNRQARLRSDPASDRESERDAVPKGKKGKINEIKDIASLFLVSEANQSNFPRDRQAEVPKRWPAARLISTPCSSTRRE